MSTSSAVPDPVWDWEAGLAQGYLGFEVDPTPNENYTLEGVGQGLPTPETDAGAAAAAKARREALRIRWSGLEDGGDVAPAKTTRSSGSTSSSSSSS